jgi:hypothetical protein
MAATATKWPSLVDLTSRLDPDGKIAKIAEILSETNEVLDDMVWLEGNLPTGHRGTIRSGLPTPTWRSLYGGVQPTKTTTVQVTDTCGMLENYNEVDKALADLNGNTAAFMLGESTGTLEGMSQEVANTLFHGTETGAATVTSGVTGTPTDLYRDPDAFTGLSARFMSSSAATWDNVILDGGTNDDHSIWIVVWGPDTVHGIYPKGSQAGLQMNYKGQVTIENVDGSNGRMEGYRTHFRWDCGLHVRDWRYIVRIQYDEGELTYNAATGLNIPDALVQGLELIPSLRKGKPAIYMNRTCRSMLRRQIIQATASSTLTQQNIGGKMVTMFDEIPVRRCDALAGPDDLEVTAA